MYKAGKIIVAESFIRPLIDVITMLSHPGYIVVFIINIVIIIIIIIIIIVISLVHINAIIKNVHVLVVVVIDKRT